MGRRPKEQQEQEQEQNQPTNENQVVSGFLAASLENNQKKFGRSTVYMGGEADKLSVVLPWPAFSLAYLCDTNGFPLGRVFGIAGKSQSQKSTLGYEISRWFCNYGGESQLVETEGRKYSLSLMRSVMSEDYANNRMQIAACNCTEDAQRHISSIVELYEKMAESKNKENAKLARRSLVSIVLDSLVGQDTEAVYEKLEKDGAVQSSYATNAKAWTGYLRWLTGKISMYPTSLVLINHLKDKINTMYPTKSTPGGDAQRFHSSIYVWVSRIRDGSKETYIQNGERFKRHTEFRTIQIEVDKNSLGEEGRKIPVDFTWYYNQDNKQVSWFDWDGATTNILVANQDVIDSRNSDRTLKDIVDIREISSSAGKVYDSSTLGLKGAAAYEIGKAVQDNKELLNELYEFFHIKCYQVWNGEMPTV